MAKIGELYVAITGDNSSLKSSLTDSSKSVSSFGSVVTKQLAGIVSATAAVGLALKGIRFNAAAESAQQAFSVMLGSAEDARDMLKELRDFANNTPLEFADIRKASQTLLQFGVDAEKVIPTIKQLGDVSGGDAQKLESLALAFGQMSSTGRLMGQDLLQMINAGFNPLRVISEQTGKSMADLKKEMEAGAISSEMVADAFKSATSEGGQFYKMLEKQAGTLNGAFSTLNDAVDTFLGTTTEGMSGPLVKAMQDATASLGKLGDNFKGVGDSIGGLVTIASAGLNGLTAILDVIPGQFIAVGSAAALAFAAFGPWGAAIAGVAAAVGALADSYTKAMDRQERIKQYAKIFMDQGKTFREAMMLATDYVDSLDKANKDLAKAYQGVYGGQKAMEEGNKALTATQSDELKKLMKEYEDATKTKVELLDQEEKAILNQAKKAGATEAELSKIRNVYNDKRAALYKEDAENAVAASKERIKTAELEAEEKLAIDKKYLEDQLLQINESQEAQREADNEFWEWKKKNSDDFSDYLIDNGVILTEKEREQLDDRVRNWASTSDAIVTGVASVSSEMGAMFVNMEKGWGGVANAAIKAIANIVRAMASELEMKASKALAEAFALTLGLSPAAIPKYAEAGGYAAGVAGIYAGAAAIETLANFGAGTAAVPRTGSYLVGEYGPEMVTLPRGASVKTNAVTEASMSRSYNVVNNFYSPRAISAIDADRFARRQMREQRMYA